MANTFFWPRLSTNSLRCNCYFGRITRKAICCLHNDFLRTKNSYILATFTVFPAQHRRHNVDDVVNARYVQSNNFQLQSRTEWKPLWHFCCLIITCLAEFVTNPLWGQIRPATRCDADIRREVAGWRDPRSSSSSSSFLSRRPVRMPKSRNPDPLWRANQKVESRGIRSGNYGTEGGADGVGVSREMGAKIANDTRRPPSYTPDWLRLLCRQFLFFSLFLVHNTSHFAVSPP